MQKHFKVVWSISSSTEVEAETEEEAREKVCEIINTGIGSSLDVDFMEAQEVQHRKENV